MNFPIQNNENRIFWNYRMRIFRNRRNEWLDRILTVRFFTSVVENFQGQNISSKFEGRLLRHHPILDFYEDVSNNFQSYSLSKSITFFLSFYSAMIFPFSDKGRGIRADGFVFSSLCYQPIKFESEIADNPFRSDATAT